MGKLFLILAVILINFPCVFGQSEKKVCPKIEINGLTGASLAKGEHFPLDVIVEGYEWNELKFEWSLSKNIPFKTQGEPVIFITPSEDHDGLEVKATVKIDGLPENCQNTVSGTFKIRFNVGTPINLARYAKLPFNKEKIELDDVVNGLKSYGGENSLALFIIRYKETEAKTTLRDRILKISNYLTDRHKLSKDRFSFILVDADENQTLVYLVPKGKGFDNLDWEKSLEKLADKPSKKTN